MRTLHVLDHSILREQRALGWETFHLISPKQGLHFYRTPAGGAQLAAHLAQTQPNLRGFTRPNLFRMRQFYDACQGNAIVSALLRQLHWTHNLINLNQSKRPEEREFYLRMASNENWSTTTAPPPEYQKPDLQLCKNVGSKTVEVNRVGIKRTVLRSG